VKSSRYFTGLLHWAAFHLLPPSPRHAASLRQVRFHIAPFENDTPPDLVIRQKSAFHPIVNGSKGFVQSPGDFGFANETFRASWRFGFNNFIFSFHIAVHSYALLRC
jgi:hypothetical protein